MSRFQKILNANFDVTSYSRVGDRRMKERIVEERKTKYGKRIVKQIEGKVIIQKIRRKEKKKEEEKKKKPKRRKRKKKKKS